MVNHNIYAFTMKHFNRDCLSKSILYLFHLFIELVFIIV